MGVLEMEVEDQEASDREEGIWATDESSSTTSTTRSSGESVAHDDSSAEPVVTYYDLFTKNPKFTWFLMSYIVTNLGEWLTYVASMSLIRTHNESSVILSILVTVRMLPNTIFGMVGGLLADAYDRKCNMVVLDGLGAAVAFLYMLYSHHVGWILFCTGLQETLSGLYQPNRSAILPSLLQQGPRDSVSPYLSKANTVTAAIWSSAAAVGASVGGLVVSRYGATTCFVLDGVFYMVSALILLCCVDTSVASHDENEKLEGSSTKKTTMVVPTATTSTMMRELLDYLLSSRLASAMILFKVSGSILFGASDVLQVAFATTSAGILDSQRLGWLFAAVGIGCFIGPLSLPDQRQHIPTIIGGFIVLSAGFGCIALAPSFWYKSFFTIFRSSGTAVLWVESTIMVQEATPSAILGRVSAIDFALAVTGEALSAVLAGYLQDQGVSAETIAGLLSMIGFSIAVVWIVWWMSYKRHIRKAKHDESVEMEPLNQ